jgi:hypothetical protein
VELPARVIAVDRDGSAVAQALCRARAAGLADRVTAVQADVVQLCARGPLRSGQDGDARRGHGPDDLTPEQAWDAVTKLVSEWELARNRDDDDDDDDEDDDDDDDNDEDDDGGDKDDDFDNDDDDGRDPAALLRLLRIVMKHTALAVVGLHMCGDLVDVVVDGCLADIGSRKKKHDGNNNMNLNNNTNNMNNNSNNMNNSNNNSERTHPISDNNHVSTPGSSLLVVPCCVGKLAALATAPPTSTTVSYPRSSQFRELLSASDYAGVAAAAQSNRLAATGSPAHVGDPAAARAIVMADRLAHVQEHCAKAQIPAGSTSSAATVARVAIMDPPDCSANNLVLIVEHRINHGTQK